MKEKVEELLKGAGIKATPNRILVTEALLKAERPMSLIELETALETLERSSVLRVLSLLSEHHLVHVIEDGRGVTRYEVCTRDHCSVADMHVHFYCESCDRTFCFEDIAVPDMHLPPEYEIHSANFMYKGRCPECR